MLYKLILGIEPWLSMALDDWHLAEPGLALEKIEMAPHRDKRFELSCLQEHDPAQSTGFVAWGPTFLNFQRLEILCALKMHGFKMPALIHPSAQVSPSACFQENAWVQAMAVIGPHVTIELNTCIALGARIGAYSQIGKNTWIGQDCRIGAWVKVGAHCMLGACIEIMDRIHIGNQARIDLPCCIEKDWPEKAFRLRARGLEGQIVDLSP